MKFKVDKGMMLKPNYKVELSWDWSSKCIWIEFWKFEFGIGWYLWTGGGMNLNKGCKLIFLKGYNVEEVDIVRVSKLHYHTNSQHLINKDTLIGRSAIDGCIDRQFYFYW